jgi:uncharacterized protein YfaS (alpha-2-macroglobulin family)
MDQSPSTKVFAAAAPMPAKKMSMSQTLGGNEADNLIQAMKSETENSLSDVSETTMPLAEPTIRKNFADTALWIGALETNKDGVAQIELDMPESLTTWEINVWTMAAGTRVGYGNTEVITRKDLILRMQTPRFLIEKDQCVFTANIHNYLTSEKSVTVNGEWEAESYRN